MNINVIHVPESKTFTSLGQTYKATYPNGYPIHVRRVWNCTDCGIEVGGHFGNKVYGDIRAKLCKGCLDKKDPIVQMCMLITGMTPEKFQKTYKRAWND